MSNATLTYSTGTTRVMRYAHELRAGDTITVDTYRYRVREVRQYGSDRMILDVSDRSGFAGAGAVILPRYERVQVRRP